MPCYDTQGNDDRRLSSKHHARVEELIDEFFLKWNGEEQHVHIFQAKILRERALYRKEQEEAGLL